MSKYGVFSGPYFPVVGLNTEVFGLKTGKYGPEKAPYLDTFHAVSILQILATGFSIKISILTNTSSFTSQSLVNQLRHSVLWLHLPILTGIL